MFRGLRRWAAAVALVVGASAVCVLAAATPARADSTDAPGDFLTVASSPAGGFDNLAPGDTASWFVTARNSGPVDALLSLRVQSDSTSRLITDMAQGLRLHVTACSDGWAASGGNASCPGVRSPIVEGPLALVLSGYRLPALPAGSATYFLAQVALPRQATNDVAGQAADLRFEITAVQNEADAPGSPADETLDHVVPTVGSAPSGPAEGAEPHAARHPAELAGTGPGHASPARSLALALLAAGSLVLVLRRLRID